MIVYTDQYAVVHDDMSKPIELGFLQFCEINTTVPKNVKDTDGNNLGSKVVLNEYGRPSTQIVLEGDYSVQIWEYIGPEFDLDDLTNFNHLRTDDVYDPTTHIVSKIGGDTTVNTIEELKAFNNATNGTTCQVNGYYQGGDCTSRVYVYNENSNLPEDNGGVIKPNEITGKGRWILVTPEVIDVRYFGVFPSSLYEEQAYYSSRLQSANNYARKYQRKIYFPLVHGNSQSLYGIDGITLRGSIKLDKGVKFVALGGTTSRIINDYGEFEANPSEAFVAGSGNITFEQINPYSKWITSQTTFTNYDKMIYNGSYAYSNISNQRVEFIESCNEDLSFVGCTLEFKSGKYLSSDCVYSFDTMVVKDEWFSGAVMNMDNITITNSQILVDNFISTKNYWLCAIENGDDYFDFKQRNMTFTESYYAKFEKDITINNGNFKMNIWNKEHTTNIINSYCYLYAGSKFGTLNLSRTNVNSNAYRIEVKSMGATDCILDANFGGVDTNGSITMSRCNISLIEGYDINLFSCQIYGEVMSKPHTLNDLYIVSGLFEGNTFMVPGYHKVWYNEATDSNIRVYIQWVGNTFLGSQSIVTPVVTDVAHFALYENQHNYVWRGNKGNCPKEIEYGTYKFIGRYTRTNVDITDASGTTKTFAKISCYDLGGMHWGYEVETLYHNADGNYYKTPANSFYLNTEINDRISLNYMPITQGIYMNTMPGSGTTPNGSYLQLCPIWDNTTPCGMKIQGVADGSFLHDIFNTSTPCAETDSTKIYNMLSKYTLIKKDGI